MNPFYDGLELIFNKEYPSLLFRFLPLNDSFSGDIVLVEKGLEGNKSAISIIQ
jgi:hypothetical protein